MSIIPVKAPKVHNVTRRREVRQRGREVFLERRGYLVVKFCQERARIEKITKYNVQSYKQQQPYRA
jgi:hypothetical protein